VYNQIDITFVFIILIKTFFCISITLYHYPDYYIFFRTFASHMCVSIKFLGCQYFLFCFGCTERQTWGICCS